MKIIHENTPEIALPEFDLFENIPVQTAIEATVYENIPPKSQLNSGAHVEFNFSTGNKEYLKPNDTHLQTRFRVKLRKIDNTPILDTDWEKVSLVNNFAHSMWSQVDLYINDVCVSSSLPTYAVMAYFQSIVNASNEACETYQKLAGFGKNDLFTDQNKIHSPNPARTSLIKPNATQVDKDVGRMCEVWAPLCLDFLKQNKNLMPRMDIKLRLIPARPEFLFQCNDTNILPSIVFDDIQLHYTLRRISGHIHDALEQSWEISPVKYPINKTEVRTHIVDAGVTNRNLDNLIIGPMPRKVYVAFVDNQAIGGAYTKNPFYFHHQNISSISCYVDSTLIDGRPQKPDHQLPYFAQEYINFLRCSGQFNNGIRTTITPEQYKEGYTIFAWDLTKSKSDGVHKSGFIDIPDKSATLRISIDFNTPLAQPISAIVYCEYDDQILINYVEKKPEKAEKK